jgi:poly [ADP-ribose] polymerase
LDTIQDKINDNTSIQDSFEELSSQFFTAIAHSFGRSRPPVIDTQARLQQRYDMCDILLDMYDANETVQKIAQQQEEEEKEKEKKPNPLDLHYESLQADLKLVDKSSEEYQIIQTYFDNNAHVRNC